MLVNQVIILFILIFIGFVLRKAGILNSDLNKGLINILLIICVPFTILSSFLNIHISAPILINMAIAFFCAAFVHIVAAVIGRLIYFKFSGEKRRILWFSAIFSNAAFMGLPVLQSIYGKPGVFYGSIYVVIFNILIWTLGITIIEGKLDLKSMRKALLNPSIIAVAAGLILFIFSIKLPLVITAVIDMGGGMTTILSMFVIGSMLAEIDILKICREWTVYIGCFVRLIVIPLIAYPVLRLMGLPADIVKIILTSAAMPVATMTAILAEKFKSDTHLASSLVVISTAFSIITIPLVVFITGRF